MGSKTTGGPKLEGELLSRHGRLARVTPLFFFRRNLLIAFVPHSLIRFGYQLLLLSAIKVGALPFTFGVIRDTTYMDRPMSCTVYS